MSYRSFKRVLGETSLERKCRFLFGGCLLLLITGSFWWYGNQTESLVYKQNPTKGRLLVDMVVIQRHWQIFKSPNETVEPDAGVRADDELRKNALLEVLSETLQDQQYEWSFIRPDRKQGSVPPANPRESEILARFLAATGQPLTEPVEWDQSDRQDRGQYTYYQAVRAKDRSCLLCHEPLGRSAAALALAGSTHELPAGVAPPLLGVAKVTISDLDTQRDLSRNRAVLLATAIITVFLAMMAAYAIVRYVIVKPLKHLRDVSDEISHGNIELRADIRTGDEFEQLGVAFNRMLRHLVAAQQELQQAGTELGAKVDELAQLNMRLFEMNRMKSDFLATMSHELRTPLNSIIGFSDVLGSIKSLDDKQRRYVQNIQKSGKSLLDMINDILDLAKIEAGRAELRLSEFRIEQTISTQCDMARPLTERKNIDLEIEIEPDLPELHQDQGKVQQVLNNLLSNAIKFTPEGGRIVVAARRDRQAERLELVVSDTGVGISEDDRQTIFEKFRQGTVVLPSGDALMREFSGTGLGLSIVKELCRVLGGEITLESELGRGSVFTVRLPWRLQPHRRPDSVLAEGLDELARAGRMDYDRLPTTPASIP